jgi:hypothetical protein
MIASASHETGGYLGGTQGIDILPKGRRAAMNDQAHLNIAHLRRISLGEPYGYLALE